MTTRKPPSVRFPDWVEGQIRQAEADGAFANLPGAGRPIPDIDRPQSELAWVANYLHRENVEIAELLPPGLALAKEVEQLPALLLRARSEARARELIDDLNIRIDVAYARPQFGPPLRVKKVQVDAALERRRAELAAMAPPPAPAAPAVERRRGWWRRR